MSPTPQAHTKALPFTIADGRASRPKTRDEILRDTERYLRDAADGIADAISLRLKGPDAQAEARDIIEATIEELRDQATELETLFEECW